MIVPGEFQALPGHYYGTNLDLSNHVPKIGQNYGIMSAEINHEFTAPPNTIFFSIFWDLERQPNRRKG